MRASESQYSQEEQLQAKSVTYVLLMFKTTAATKTENTHLSFSDSFRLGLHEFFFCGEVRSVARAHVLIYKENSNIILSPLGIT